MPTLDSRSPIFPVERMRTTCSSISMLERSITFSLCFFANVSKTNIFFFFGNHYIINILVYFMRSFINCDEYFQLDNDKMFIED